MSDFDPKDMPLKCSVDGEHLVFRIGIGTLAFAANNAHAIADELDVLRNRVADPEATLRTSQYHREPATMDLNAL